MVSTNDEPAAIDETADGDISLVVEIISVLLCVIVRVVSYYS